MGTYVTKSFDINRGQEIIYQNPLSCLNDNSLQCILTTMIAFVTWPPFLYHHYYKGGQVTKPIIVVRIHCKLIVIQAAKRILVNNFLALVDIKAFCRICTHLQCCFFLASHLFYTQGVFV